jgi:hypothetical protein
MSEHRLDEADVRAVLQHQRRHGVAEQVTRTALAATKVPPPGRSISGWAGGIKQLTAARCTLQRARLAARALEHSAEHF